VIFAADIGGTKANLALYEQSGGKLRRVARQRFVSREFGRFEDVIGKFLREEGADGKVTAAGIGAAGPVAGDEVKITHLNWHLRATSLGQELGVPSVTLLNDLEAAGHGLARLGPEDLYTLNAGTAAPQANRALIAAGTGLGEAILTWNGEGYNVLATEGGHCDFAPRTETEIELLRFMKKRFANVCYDQIVSGKGFKRIHEFFAPEARHTSFEDPASDGAPEICRLAKCASCRACVKTLDLWVALYGSEAGNLALKCLARGGVYVGGGIAPKVQEKLKEGAFFEAFCQKSNFSILLEQFPIYIIVNEDAPLLGAASCAAARAGIKI